MTNPAHANMQDMSEHGIAKLLCCILLIVHDCSGIKTVTKEEGEYAELHCPSKSKDYAKAKWYKMEPNSKITHIQTITTSDNSLTIKANLNRTGSYRCELIDYDGNVFHTCEVEMDVYVLPNISLDVTQGPYELGQQISINCTINRVSPLVPLNLFNITFTNNPEVWYRTTSRPEGKTYFVGISDFITATRKYQDDTVTCTVSTEKMSQSRSFIIRLNDCSGIKTVTKEEGEYAELHCPSKSKDYAKAKWYKKEPNSKITHIQTITTSDNSLTIKANLNRTGSYRCELIDYDGSVFNTCEVEMDVYVLPNISLDVTQGPYELGQQISINCTIDRVSPLVPLNLFNITFTNNPEVWYRTTSRPEGKTYFVGISDFITATRKYQDDTVTCTVSTEKMSQSRSFIIRLNDPNQKPLPIILWTSIPILLVVLGTTVLAVLYWFRKRRTRNNETEEAYLEMTEPVASIREEQQDGIDNPQVQHDLESSSSEDHDYLVIVSSSSDDERSPETAGAAAAETIKEKGNKNKDRGNPETSGASAVEARTEKGSTSEEDGSDGYLKPAKHGISCLHHDCSGKVYESRLPSPQGEKVTADVHLDEKKTDNDLTAEGAAQNLDGYEKLRWDVEETTELQTLLERNGLSKETCEKLQNEQIETTDDLMQMTYQHIFRLRLQLGQEVRLRKTIEKLKEVKG